MDRLLFTPVEAARQLSFSRSKVYSLIAAGEIRSVRAGGSRRIPASALAEYIGRLELDAATTQPK